MPDTITELFGPPVYTYTRADALADGTLHDVSPIAREAGITFPVALTDAVWEKCVAWTPEDNHRKRNHTLNDQDGRLWDVVWMLKCDLDRASVKTRERRYYLHVVPRQGTGHVARLTMLKSICGPGDTGEPVITIMLPEED